MLELPATTLVQKRIPKQKFYEHLTVSQQIRRSFIEQIQSIIWKNKLSPDVLNVERGESVTEIEFIELVLREKVVNREILELIDREIPYHIVFFLHVQEEFQAHIGYKELSCGKNAFKVAASYHTEWLAWEDLPLALHGLNLDTIYENFVRQIAGDRLRAGEQHIPLHEAVEREKQRQQLRRQITLLEHRIQREKQFRKQVEMRDTLRKLRAKLETL